jgi:hypothetical protein
VSAPIETPQEHSSLVGGSTAARRIGCPGSLAREKIAPKSKGSAYAREGTALHEMMARILDRGEEPEDLLPFTHHQPAKGVEEPWSLTIDADKWDDLGQPALDMFYQFLDEIEAEAGADATMMVEVSGEFPGIEGAFGTSDVPFRCGHIGGIWDWKFGRRKVSAEENKQLMFYFAALRQKYPTYFDGVTDVRLCISQPQSMDEPEVWQTNIDRIDAFIGELHEAIEIAQQPDAPIAKGSWCAFADCKAVCELHIGAAARLGGLIGELSDRREAAEATAPGSPAQEQHSIDMDTYLSDAMELAEMAESWSKHIAAITEQRLSAGLPVTGWKVVPKASSGRVWTADDDVVVSRLKSRGMKADQYYAKKVVTPPAAEKVLKKLGKTLPDDIVEKKPSSGFTLTRDGDPRPEAVTANGKAAALGSALLRQLGHENGEENGN